jgi:trehalose-6-phosphate synthase
MVIDHVPRRRVIALLTVADICIVVPKRDGMNLVAKEFSIANADTAGVLVLGEGAGAVHELGPGSVTVDHCDPRSIHDGLCRALDTSESERRAMAIERATAVRAWTASDWSHHFLDTLTTRTHTTGTRTTGPVSDEAGLGTSAITG